MLGRRKLQHGFCIRHRAEDFEREVLDLREIVFYDKSQDQSLCSSWRENPTSASEWALRGFGRDVHRVASADPPLGLPGRNGSLFLSSCPCEPPASPLFTGDERTLVATPTVATFFGPFEAASTIPRENRGGT
jgi:hypothetical protein